MNRRTVWLLLAIITPLNTLMAQSTDDPLLTRLLQDRPEWFSDVLKNKAAWNVQVIYTEINRRRNGKARFTDHFFNRNDTDYFYPASTVKLPIAILALQRLHELNIPGLDADATMITEQDGDRQTLVYNDPSAPDGRPTIAHYIKKILLVSDNDAFNRLYEFLGQEYINNRLHQMGYSSTQIIHRLNVTLSEAENRHTNPIRFFDKNGNLLYAQPARQSSLVYAQRDTKMGSGYMRGDELVKAPFDFSKKNRLVLADLHRILRSILFPNSVPRKERFSLTDSDYALLRKYMSMQPGESKWPAYDSTAYWDTYVKFMLYGAERHATLPGVRIFNKPGDAYGFMIDAAYVVDFSRNTEFLASAVIYCNSDGIFNDDKYDYATVGLPFFKHLGQALHEYEWTRKRKFSPDLSSLRFLYTE